MAVGLTGSQNPELVGIGVIGLIILKMATCSSQSMARLTLGFFLGLPHGQGQISKISAMGQ